VTSSRTTWSIRAQRYRRREQSLTAWKHVTEMAVLLSVGAGCMMAIVVEVYQANLLSDAASLPQSTHTQALAAACVGFLPAFLCLQRLNSGSWSRAIRYTLPWLILVPDAIVTLLVQLRWYWALAIAIPLGVVAYQSMFRIARNLKNG
jgi:hypothetical protein